MISFIRHSRRAGLRQTWTGARERRQSFACSSGPRIGKRKVESASAAARHVSAYLPHFITVCTPTQQESKQGVLKARTTFGPFIKISLCSQFLQNHDLGLLLAKRIISCLLTLLIRSHKAPISLLNGIPNKSSPVLFIKLNYCLLRVFQRAEETEEKLPKIDLLIFIT